MKKRKRIYLDYASTTPLDKKVLKAMKPFFEKQFANPSSLYSDGVLMRKSVERCRKEIADILHSLPNQLIFTASGTESNNLAILGTFYFFKKKINTPHFITSSIEHPSVLDVFRVIERMGGEVSYVLPDEAGIIDPKKIWKELRQTTVLVSIMYANNEIGTINPIKEISKVVRKFKKDNQTEMPYVHTDASQAAHYLDMNLSALNIDLLTIDASKLYGPKGIGLLYKKSHVEIEPLMFGGGQENGLRPGTENVAAIVGLCESLMIAESLKIKESARIKKLRDYFISHVLKISDCTLNGSLEYRLPNNINICFKGMNAEYAVFLLDAAGFCVSSVTSCLNLSEESSSYVIDALQPPGQDSKKNEKNNKCSSSSLRITLGRSTQKKEISSLLKVLPDIIDKARKN